MRKFYKSYICNLCSRKREKIAKEMVDALFNNNDLFFDGLLYATVY